MTGLRATAVLCVGLAACVHAPVAPPVTVTAAPPAPPPWYGDVRALAREVAALRGLELTATFDVVELEDDAFAETLRTTKPTMDAADTSNATVADFVGVVLPKPDGDVQSSALTEMTEAFYDRFTKRIVLRKRASQAGLFMLAHELGHVLQDQQGLLARGSEYRAEPVAWRALIEGDAMLTALLWKAKHTRRPAARVVEEARFADGSLVRALTGRAGPADMDARLVEWSQWAYLIGMRFFADVYAAGGLELVNRILRGPPVGLEAFVATERWLEEGTRRLVPLSDPPRRLGLFGIRGLLQTCLAKVEPQPPPNFFEHLDALYLDDSFRRSNGVLTWVTAWASHGEVGKGFTQTFLRCVGFGKQDVVFDQREGVVAAVVKAPSADGKRLASAAARTPLETSGPALGIALPPRSLDRTSRKVGAGTLTGETWRHDALKLSIRLPGVASTQQQEPTLLDARAPGLAMGVVFIDEPTTRDDASLKATLSAMAWLVANGVDYEFDAPDDTPWTSGPVAGSEQTTMELPSSMVLRAVRIPVLNDEASVVVWGIAIHAGARAQLESWLSSIRAE